LHVVINLERHCAIYETTTVGTTNSGLSPKKWSQFL